MFPNGVELTKSKSIKYCTDSNCRDIIPICCLHIIGECSEGSFKWNHFSLGEHVCSHCFAQLQTFFSYEISSQKILNWKKSWMTQSFDNPSPSDYISGVLLPYWCVCVSCGKWRQVSRNIILSPNEMDTFECSVVFQHSSNPCHIIEDKRVDIIKTHPHRFLESIKYKVLLETVPFLSTYDRYLLDTVGIMPTATEIDFDLPKPCSDFLINFNPFSEYVSTDNIVGAVNPACIDRWEHEKFPDFQQNIQRIFVGVRNLIFLLWAADPKRVVTEKLIQKCCLVRGLVRVALLTYLVPVVLRIYAVNGYINFGFTNCIDVFRGQRKRVIVIGAGLSGVAAALHLISMGADVTVLECNLPITEDSRTIPMKWKTMEYITEIIGARNNPVMAIAHQLNIKMEEIFTDLFIFNSKGQEVDETVDKYFENFVYKFLPFVMEQSPLLRTLENFRHWMISDLYEHYRKSRISKEYIEKDSVEDVYLAELEYRVFGGASITDVPVDFNSPNIASNMFNFSYKKFSGQTVVPCHGWNYLIDKLLESVKIVYSNRVKSIHKNENNYSVNTAYNSYEADKILFATSPSNYSQITSVPDWLNRNSVDSNDDKPGKSNACPNDTFIIIKMAFDYDSLFWRKKLPVNFKGTFSIVPESSEMRGFCHLFRESKQLECRVLQTSIFGTASKICSTLSDEEIINKVLQRLSCLFNKNEKQPNPLWYEIMKLDSCLSTATKTGQNYSKFQISKYYSDVFVTNKIGNLAEPVNLTNSFCIGMEAAANMLRDCL